MIGLRSVSVGDCGRLFEWVNQPDCLANKATKNEKISFEEHENWFSHVSNDPQYYLWIIEKNQIAAGQLRFSPVIEGFEVDIYIAEAYRKNNLAVTALAMGYQKVCGAFAGKALIAYIKYNNLVSQKLFERAGFSLCQNGKTLKKYKLILYKDKE